MGYNRNSNLWWPSSTFSGEVADLRSQSCITGEWSASEAMQSCVATSGCQQMEWHFICNTHHVTILTIQRHVSTNRVTKLRQPIFIRIVSE